MNEQDDPLQPRVDVCCAYLRQNGTKWIDALIAAGCPFAANVKRLYHVLLETQDEQSLAMLEKAIAEFDAELNAQ